ncbi:alpha/beta fold hydrolase [Streptomyces sp. NPDC021020]|uniref:alpha/beta fold hydrolase n=1 Tax=Streptomyces sp. NPDC021020 TaxID=3365109 RepID=UPI00379C4ADC
MTAALAALVSAVRDLAGLTDQVGRFALPAGTCDRAPDLVAAVCLALEVPLAFDAPADGPERDFAVAALAAEIRRIQRAPELAGLDADGVARAADEARRLADEEDAGYRRHAVRRPDGTVLTVVEAGPAGGPCVLLSPACSMGHRLSLPWLGALSRTHRCVVPQTRGTGERIDDPADFDTRGHDVPHQADDLLALVEALDTGPVHLMGLCGGAAPALLAAARQPGSVSSLSLWHADLELGGDAEKTDHQANMRALLDLAGESRDSAAWVRRKLVSGPMTGVPAGVGPLVVRPYATTELFYRYARLTGATMHWDSRETAARVAQPCLVVTSRDDHIAHPAGSRQLARILPDARLAVTEHGTHLDAFAATPAQVSRLRTFLAAAPAG